MTSQSCFSDHNEPLYSEEPFRPSHFSFRNEERKFGITKSYRQTQPEALDIGPQKKSKDESWEDCAYDDNEEQYRIGSHIEEPNIPIYCKLNDKGTPYTWAPKEMVIDEEILGRWSTLVSENDQVPLDKVELDAKIRQSTFMPINSLDPKRKEAILKDYLLARKGDKKSRKEVKVEPGKTLALQDLHVGVMKNDRIMRVYSYLRQPKLHNSIRTVMFRTHREDWDESSMEYHKSSVNYEQILFMAKIKKDTMEDTKEHIRSLINERESAIAEKRKASAQFPVIILGDQVDQSPKKKKIDNAVDLCYLLDSFDSTKNSIKIMMEGAEEKMESQKHRINQHLATIASQQALIQQLENEARMLKSETRREKRSDHRSPFADLKPNYKSASDGKSTPAIPNNISTFETQEGSREVASSSQALHIRIGQQEFCLIPDGQPNAGMYRERTTRVIMENGKTYEERVVLKQFEINVTGRRTGQEVEVGGVKCVQLVENGLEKLVQKYPSPKMVASDGKCYMSWFILMQKSVEADEGYDI